MMFYQNHEGVEEQTKLEFEYLSALAKAQIIAEDKEEERKALEKYTVSEQNLIKENIRLVKIIENVSERNRSSLTVLKAENKRLREALENIKTELKMFKDKYDGSESRD